MGVPNPSRLICRHAGGVGGRGGSWCAMRHGGSGRGTPRGWPARKVLGGGGAAMLEWKRREIGSLTTRDNIGAAAGSGGRPEFLERVNVAGASCSLSMPS